MPIGVTLPPPGMVWCCGRTQWISGSGPDVVWCCARNQWISVGNFPPTFWCCCRSIPLAVTS